MSERRGRLSGAEAESAIGFMRNLVAVTTAVVIVSTRTSASTSVLMVGVATGCALIAEALAMSWLLPQFIRRDQRRWRIAVVQAIDTLWFLELTVLLSHELTGGVWVLLVLPVVLAALRLSSLAVLNVWLLAAGGYTISIWAGLVQVDESGTNWAVHMQRVGVLLLVAACVALLTRWLQEGWLTQAELTSEVDDRLTQLQAVERAARSLQSCTAEEIVGTAPSHVVSLGFEAGTIARHGKVLHSAGSRTAVPQDVEMTDPPPSTIEITRWTGRDNTALYSAAVSDAVSGLTIAGWSSEEIPDSKAQAMFDLGATIATSLQSASLLAKVRHEATHDALTGLCNRGEINRALAASAATQDPSSVLFIDLDHFKAVNDVYGHQMGDKLLVHIARRIGAAVSDRGVAGRYGGDEFIVVLSGAEASRARSLATELLGAMEQPFELDSQSINATFSIGVGFASGAVSADALLNAADAAAYEAKADGRNSARIAHTDLVAFANSETALTDGQP
jgi:diguanylate cyclase (GGDEF)-like protein